MLTYANIYKSQKNGNNYANYRNCAFNFNEIDCFSPAFHFCECFILVSVGNKIFVLNNFK